MKFFLFPPSNVSLFTYSQVSSKPRPVGKIAVNAWTLNLSLSVHKAVPEHTKEKASQVLRWKAG